MVGGMRPALQVWVEGGRYLARCYGCAMQCERTASEMPRAILNLPCRGVVGVWRTMNKGRSDGQKACKGV